MTKYYPNRARCRDCYSQGLPSCQALDFAKMPVHRRDGADVIVTCTSFKQLNQGASLSERTRQDPRRGGRHGHR